MSTHASFIFEGSSEMLTHPSFMSEYSSQTSTKVLATIIGNLREWGGSDSNSILLMALAADFVKSSGTCPLDWHSSASKHRYLEDTIKLSRKNFKGLDQIGVVFTLFSKKHCMAYRRLSEAQTEAHEAARIDFAKLYPDQARVLENYANEEIESFPEDFFAQL